MLSVALIAVTALGIAAAPVIVYVGAPGFAAEPAKFDVTVSMLRVTFPYIIFISLVSLAGGILNTWSRFVIPAFTPTLLNLSFILCALFAAPYFDPPVMVLAWAVFLGGVLQLALQLPALSRNRHAAAAQPRVQRSGCAAHSHAHGAGGGRRVGKPDQSCSSTPSSLRSSSPAACPGCITPTA